MKETLKIVMALRFEIVEMKSTQQALQSEVSRVSNGFDILDTHALICMFGKDE